MSRKNLLKGIKRPKSVLSFVPEHLDATYGKFTASPFEPGYGTTVGNTLRRVLLSSIQGYAITAVKITSYDAEALAHGISSEFEAIPNVVEDTIEVLGNMKKIRLAVVSGNEEETHTYEWKGKKEVMASDFAVPGKIEVVSKEPIHIMTLSGGAHVEFDVQFEEGRGYVPQESNAAFIDVVGTIPMDAIFSPVQKVKYVIQPCRVGQRSDYDKLVIEVWTDGTKRPDDALAQAAKIVKEHMQIFINFDEADESAFLDDDDMGEERMQKILGMTIDELDLSVRSKNGLERENIKNLGELVKWSESRLAEIPNFGKRSLQEIIDKLRDLDLKLAGDAES